MKKKKSTSDNEMVQISMSNEESVIADNFSNKNDKNSDENSLFLKDVINGCMPVDRSESQNIENLN